MAKNMKTENQNPIGDIDLSAFLPEGYAKDDLVTVGGLRPIAPAPVTFENRSPIAGFILGVLDMPDRDSITEKGKKEPWQTLLVRLTKSTFAMVGEDVVEVAAGKDVLIPISGSLGNNHDLLIAAQDPEKVYWGLLSVVGQVDTGKPTPMWNYDVKLHKQTIERTGQYAIFARPKRTQQIARTSDGTAYDPKTGEVRSAVGASA